MTKLYGKEKPSLEDIEHHGVKGQKWGTTKGRKPTTSDIVGARARLGSQVRTINSQIDKTIFSSGKAQEKNAKELVKLTTAHLNSPDQATALRMTKGEKWTVGLVSAAFPVVAPATGLGVGLRVHARHQIEKQQGTR